MDAITTTRSYPAWRRWIGDGRPALPVLVAAALALLAALLDWRGADLPAQLFRVLLFRQNGFVLWNNLWYGGHPTLDYSVLFPPLGAVVGPLLLGAVSGVVAAYCFDRLLRNAFGTPTMLASLWFAVSTVTNLAVGRLTFSLGVAIALASLLALQRGHRFVAVVLGLLSPLASPVATVFLVVAVAAWAGFHRDRWPTGLALVSAATVPMVVIGLAFPEGGQYPYAAGALVRDLGVCVLVFLLVPRTADVVRRGAVLYALLAVAVFLVPNALGGNVSRLAQYAAGPLLVCALWPHRRKILAAVALPLLFWQWYPALDGIAFANQDPSTRASFYTPLLTFLRAQPGPNRVEIPFTLHHWEAVEVAPVVPLARGWERQMDIAANGLFYDDTLDAATYERWLADNGVGFVALARAPLDDSAEDEAALIRGGLPYLSQVWSNRDWQVFRFDRDPGLVTGPAALISLGADRFTLDVAKPGDVLVRIRASSHWSVPAGGCAAEDPSGWTVLRHLPLGRVEISQSLVGTTCPDED